MDVLFVLDSSSNVGSSNWNSILTFVNLIVTSLNIGDTATRVGVITFSDSAYVSINLNAYFNKGQLSNAILNLGLLTGGRNIQNALLTARNTFTTAFGARPEVPDVVIFITGGASTTNAGLVAQEARMMRRAGITVYAIGVTNSVNQTELQTISSHPHLINHQLWSVSDYGSSLTNIVNGVIGELCVPALGKAELSIHSKYLYSALCLR